LKIKYKITVLFTLLVTAILLVLNISIYYLIARDTTENFRKRLRSRASNNAQIFDFSGDSSLTMLRKVDGGSLAMLPQKTVAIYDTLGQVLYSYRSEGADTIIAGPELLQEIRATGEDYFKIGKRDVVGVYFSGNRAFYIIVAADNEDGLERLSQLKKVLIISLLIGVFVTLVTGYIFSAQLVRPISHIIREVNTISSHNLSKRLNTGISQDELNQLAHTFNELLDRLQDSFNTQRRFISNASHEISTPLTSISSQLQVTLQNERSGTEYRRVLQSIQEDVEQMRQLTKGLLEIARTGSQGAIELNDLRIDELLLKVISDVKKNNPNFDVVFQFDDIPEEEEQCRVFGNFDLLYSALKNIIENGCKYSPDKTSLVEVKFTGLQVVISIINKGDVITGEEIQQLFQPFFRGANAADTKGFGLGLPLAKRIVSLHHGTIHVESDPESTRFQVTLPTLMQSKTAF
jgi:Signal transduction histidine kinase